MGRGGQGRREAVCDRGKQAVGPPRCSGALPCCPDLPPGFAAGLPTAWPSTHPPPALCTHPPQVLNTDYTPRAAAECMNRLAKLR